MKTKIFNHVAILLILAGSFSSCTKKADSNDVDNVPFKPCPCETNDGPLGTIKGEVRLFVDEPSLRDIEVIVYESYVYDCFLDRAYLKLNLNSLPFFSDNLPDMPATLNICNFPDFAKQWETSSGVDVYYEGIVYPNCEEFGCRAFCYTFILTKFKII